MKFVFASYVYTKEYNDPEAWLRHIRFYGGILEALSKTNEVISIEQIDYQGRIEFGGVDYQFKRFYKIGRYFPFSLHRYIKNLHPDVVFIQSLQFPLQVIQLRLMLGKKVKIIVQNHAERPFTGIKKYLQRIADRYIDAYLFASRDMGVKWITKGNLSTPGKIHEVMEVSSVFYPIEKAAAKQKTAVIGEPVFLWVGRLNENKDPLTMVKAFLKFVDCEPSARLYMIYHTAELLTEVTNIIKNSPNRHTVVLVGKVRHDDLLNWYNSADFIVSASHYEGSGTAICEAMSCGCIPIVTNIFSFRMITDNGKCGLLYERGNELALSSALMQTQTLDRAAMRHSALSYYNKNLSFEAIAGRIHDIADAL